LLTVLSFHYRFSRLCKQQEKDLEDLKKQCDEARNLMWRTAEEDKRQAFEILRQVVDRGYGLAQQLADGNGEPPQCWLACCYELGIGVPEDLNEALRLHSEGASQGEKFSIVNVGFLLYF
jgi:TPR repeat protein